MDKLTRFKELSSLIPMQQKMSLYKKFVASPEQGMESIVQIASEYGLDLTKEEVSMFIREIDEQN
tara:strand:- start:143 stop:337 length:195 start_codon:yes stop_codon:yes gene_type:complete